MADLPYRVFEWRGDEQPQFVAIFSTLPAMGCRHKEYERTRSFSRWIKPLTKTPRGRDSGAKMGLQPPLTATFGTDHLFGCWDLGTLGEAKGRLRSPPQYSVAQPK